MKSEVWKMFKYPSMIKAASFCAAVFALFAVIFKNSIVLIPEVSEIRLCNALAVSFGIWFGPAGAWGCAVGNLIGDLDGSLTWLSLFGFIGNFFSAWIPYKIWGIMSDYYGESRFTRPDLSSRKNWLKIVHCILLSVVSCCAFLCISFDLYPVMPAVNACCMLAVNNISASVLGIFLFWLMSDIPESILPYWRSLMKDEEVMYFPKEHMRKVQALTIGSVIYCVFVVLYMTLNGLSLSVMDEYNSLPIIIASSAITIYIVVITYLCKWKESRVELTL